MLKNYLKIALRTLRKHKGYTLINVLGLAVGLACCLLILLYVQDELRYDTFHEKADRIHRVVRTSAANGPYPLAPALEADFPEVEHAVRLYRTNDVTVRHDGEIFKEPVLFWADPDVFDAFTFPFVQGDPATALDAPDAIVITETAARTYFGGENPLGKVLTFDGVGEVTVTGVMQDVPANSHIRFDVLGSFRMIETLSRPYMQNWTINASTYTYILLREDADPNALQAKFPAFIERHTETAYDDSYLRLELQPLTDIRLHSDLYNELGPVSDIAYVYVFSVVGLFILMIACINFMNLTTARATQRAKEVGMRKVLGAGRRQLIGQFLAESTLMATLATLLALLLAELTLPVLNTLSQKALSLETLNNSRFVLQLVGIALGVGVLAGSYPAFVLSAFRPVKTLKGRPLELRSGIGLRKALVVTQYAIAIVLMIGTGVIYSQLQFIQSKNLGFDTEQVVAVNIEDHPILERIQAFKEAVRQAPSVINASVASDVPGGTVFNDWLYLPEGASSADRQAYRGLITFMVDEDYLETIGLDLVEGRNFAKDRPSDDEAILINETAARQFGWDEPVGKRLHWYRFVDAGAERAQTFTVIGVVKDFHFKSLHEPIQPIVLQRGQHHLWTFAVRLAGGQLAQGFEALKQQWTSFTGEPLIDYAFLDHNVDALYRAEQRLSRVFTIFAGLAIFIACLGLFGLATFSAERRTKEIGIRKVLGASVASIVALLSKDFLKLILIAAVIASPLAYIAMNQWLRDFAYRIELPWPIFLAAGGLVLVIALATVSYQSIRAATANPVESLRYE